MNYIFNHEQLRLDELMKKISAKTKFFPQKPLKSYRNFHKSSGSKKKNSVRITDSTRISPRNIKLERFFPLLPKLSNNSSPTNTKLGNSELEAFECLDIIRAHRENLAAYNNRDSSVKPQRLPDILKKKTYSLDSKREVKLVKKKKLIITHIPSVSYFQDNLDKTKHPLSKSLNL